MAKPWHLLNHYSPLACQFHRWNCFPVAALLEWWRLLIVFTNLHRRGLLVPMQPFWRTQNLLS